MDLNLTEKTALVCGGSRGIGFACARSLAAEGVCVTLVARVQESLDEAVKTIEEEGGQAKSVKADLSVGDSLNTIVAAVAHADIGRSYLPVQVFHFPVLCVRL